MTPERYQVIRKVLDQRQPDLTVITDEVHKGRNLSAIIRTCDSVGIDTIHCVIPKAGFRAYRGTAMGSHKWVHAQSHDCVSEPITLLKSQGYQVVAAHLSDTAVDYRDVDYTLPTALLLGTEKQGVSNMAQSSVDKHVVIPMKGMATSLNVSVACAVILAECQRQRQLAGYYEHPRLTSDQYQQRLFQWAHPVVTRFCDERGLAYPPLAEDGEILNAPEWYKKIRTGEQK